MTAGINRAIAEAQQRGIVTSATLMANSHAFDGAAAFARTLAGDKARFSVGCHVVLLDGEPVLPADRVASLLQPGAQNGSQFRVKLNDFVLASFRGKLRPDEIEAESAAQMQRLQEVGVEPSHFDTHKHAHMFPAVLRPLLRAARARNVPAVRNPFGQVWPLPLARCAAPPPTVETICPAQRVAQLSLQSSATKLRPTVCAPPTVRWLCWSPAVSTWTSFARL